MVRSFSDRVLGGVCGGIAETLHVSGWLVRGLSVILTIASFGFGCLVYLALWWALPQRSMVRTRNGGAVYFLVVLVLIGIMSALWIGRDMTWLQTSAGQSLFLPLVVLMLSVVFLLRQVR
ncbi:MAG TPA: PspC domain-containing protein [Phototrophicaceae bacterium]|jgi:phage shock protein PspC (stress-responsive transcriptional regulator)|nr:PspC domain-containing protein [Phototrophicaceae bacterium]